MDSKLTDDTLEREVENAGTEAEYYSPCDLPPPDDALKQKAQALDHSKPLDIHKWSDDPAVDAFVNAILATHFPNPRSKKWKKHLKVVLLDLYVTWCDDPELKIAVSLNPNSYRPKSKYNALNISKMMIEIIKELDATNLIETAPGYYNPQKGCGRRTRIWPTAALITQFEATQFSPFKIAHHPFRQSIVLKDTTGEEIEYEDNDEIREIRKVLASYNALLQRHFIDIPTLDQRYVLNAETGVKVQINPSNKFVYRVFNRGSFDKGGRFYGGWWQNIPKEWRQKIFINDRPTVERDYSGLHIVLLYAGQGIAYLKKPGDDPYAVEQLPFLNSAAHTRACAKRLLLIALNAKDEASAFAAFREKYSNGSAEKRFTNAQLSTLLDRLKTKHQAIAHYLASDAGVDLMYQDAQIAEDIIKKHIEREIPILTIHDSFIVPTCHAQFLAETMEEALRRNTGDVFEQIESGMINYLSTSVDV